MHIFNLLSQQYFLTQISLSSNFLEANVFNIILLLSGLIYVLKEFLGSILSTRQQNVLFAINESEERLNQANIRLSEAEKQITQTQIVIEQIVNEAETTAEKVRHTILEQGTSDIERLTISSKASIKYAEYKVKQEIQKQIISLALAKVKIKLHEHMTSSIQSQIIEKNIMQLEGNFSI
uniref:ATP synthase subunit b, chloroplastic n=1 Tax=Platysiphonia delicata TaxID=2006979 RepID=A0A1Z1M0H4_9FLOR|nr:ATP synthase CF0 subunit I [Platysiphonia delicata]ARW59578.1 ATP synthase CF0 subunit I [Platysiphonia delicata]